MLGFKSVFLPSCILFFFLFLRVFSCFPSGLFEHFVEFHFDWPLCCWVCVFILLKKNIQWPLSEVIKQALFKTIGVATGTTAVGFYNLWGEWLHLNTAWSGDLYGAGGDVGGKSQRKHRGEGHSGLTNLPGLSGQATGSGVMRSLIRHLGDQIGWGVWLSSLSRLPAKSGFYKDV